MKKVLSMLFALTFVFATFAGCSDDSDDETTTAADANVSAGANDTQPEDSAKKAFKVASHNAVIEGNSYRAVYENQMSEAIDLAKKDGYVSEYNSFVANNDPATESQQIEQTINEGYDIIIVNPIASSGLDPLIDKAIDAGITYVNADCIYDSDKILNVVVDQAAWAKIQSDFVIKTLGAGKKVIQFNGIDGNSASEIRNEVWANALKDAGLEVVKTVAHNWSDVESKQLMSEIISSGLEYDGIINQEAANGILDAIEEAKVDYPGCITSSEEIAWIRRIADLNKSEEVLPFIVVENPPGIGATALAVAINKASGAELKDDTVTDGNVIYYTPQWVMTYDNMQEKLDSVADKQDSDSVSSYLTIEEAKEKYFK